MGGLEVVSPELERPVIGVVALVGLVELGVGLVPEVAVVLVLRAHSN